MKRQEFEEVNAKMIEESKEEEEGLTADVRDKFDEKKFIREFK